MKNFTFTLILSILAIAQLNVQNVNSPDANFKSYLIANAGINTNSDTEIQLSEAQSFSGIIECRALSISDVSGIYAFTNITGFHCDSNLITSIDLSNNIALMTLDLGKNQLSNLNVSNNTALEVLSYEHNQISSIDLSNNLALKHLVTKNNLHTELDISANIALITINVDSNQLSSLNLSNNNALALIDCANNQLTALDVASGNNQEIVYFHANNNPNLTCIQVDDANYSNNAWVTGTLQFFMFDSGSSFNVDCGYLDIKTEKLIDMSIFPNPTRDFITIATKAKINSSSIYDIAGNFVANFKGKEYSVTHLKPGLYFINVNTDIGTVQHKLLIQQSNYQTSTI